jgi:NAD(P)-dependent dehydrogenase (short-subunit alcohol dehydrogenase family)
MDLGLTDKIAIVTAPAWPRFASATALADEGCRVAIAARGEERLRQAAAELRAPRARTIAFSPCAKTSRRQQGFRRSSIVRRCLGGLERS